MCCHPERSFVTFSNYGERGRFISFKTDPDEQPLLVEQERFTVSRYIGQHGWVDLHLDREPLDWDEIEEWVITSYRRSALARMLRELDG